MGQIIILLTFGHRIYRHASALCMHRCTHFMALYVYAHIIYIKINLIKLLLFFLKKKQHLFLFYCTLYFILPILHQHSILNIKSMHLVITGVVDNLIISLNYHLNQFLAHKIRRTFVKASNVVRNTHTTAKNAIAIYSQTLKHIT